MLAAQTGSSVSATTPPLLAVTAISGLIGVLAALFAARAARNWGAGTLLAAVAVVVFTGLSITWSVAPDLSWFETNRTIAYVAVMAGGVAAARLAPSRWQAPLGGILLGSTVVIGLGLASKVFPSALDPDQLYARLQEPIGYWNAIGAIAAFTLVLSLWLGTRRNGYRPFNALAYPVAALAVITLLQSYSRGSLAAAGVGIVVWIIFAPRRLHSLLVLAVGVLGGGFVGIWAFANAALSTDKVVLAARESAGTEFGVLLAATIVFLLLVGLAIEFATVFTGMQGQERRRLGVFVACIVAIIPLAGIGVLASSPKGLTGSISNAYTQLTDPAAAIPSSDPSRLGEVSSARSLYWREAIRLYRAQPLHGVGAGGFEAVQPRARQESGAVARHAHGWVPQTLADMGWMGMLVQLLLGLTWIGAATRALGVWGPLRRGARRAERDGTAAAVAIVATFAVASVADWTWFVPGVALPMMLLAGWVAGRGAEAAFAGGAIGRRPSLSLTSPRTAVAAAVLAVTVIACFSLVQPWRSEQEQDAALTAVFANDLPTAESRAREARRVDPLSPEADYTLARVLVEKGDVAGARRLYEDAIELEPAVPDSWARLAQFEQEVAGRPFAALQAAGVALKLAPTYRPARLVAIAANQEIVGKRQARAAEREAKRAAREAKKNGTAPPAAGAATGATGAAAPATGTAAPAAGTTTPPADPATPAAGAGTTAAPPAGTATTP